MSPTRSVRSFPAALLAITLAWGAFYVHRTSFSFEGERVFCLWDDAMISMQYARNLSEGRGLVWMAGQEPVQGISNLGIALVMSAIHLLPLAPERMALAFQLVNLALLGASVLLVWGIGRRAFPARPEVATAASLATALCAPLAVWSLLGADVGFVTAWLLAGMRLVAAAERCPPWGLAALAPGLLLRPDAIVFFAVLLVAACAVPGGPWRAALAAAVGAGVLAGWALLGTLYYGDPLPNTYYLKATGAPRGVVLRAGLLQLAEWLPRLALPLALGAFGAWRERSHAVARACAGSVVVALLYTVWVGGDWSSEYGTRFVVPALPGLLLLCAVGASHLAATLPRLAPPAARAACVAAAALAALVAGPGDALSEWLDPRTLPKHAAFNRNNFFFARYLARHTDPSTSLGAHWAGVPPYFSRRPAVDVLGKSDRHIAKLPARVVSPGHSKWDWDYVIGERRPDVFRAPSRGLRDRDDFRSAYVRVVKDPRNRFYMRRDALAKLRDPRVQIVDLHTGERSSLAEAAAR
ncbi:MAG: hypothetical protein QNK04_14675 [Myxococcota bacterium]|nr:hypothetical protein [Myxococcota bacterium]